MKKIAVILILLAGIITSSAYCSYVYFTVKDWNDLIYKGVKIEDTDLSGMTKEEAMNIIKRNYSDKVLKKKIIIKYRENEYHIDYEQLNAKYNIQDTVEEAYAYAKDKGMFQKYKLINNPKEKIFKLRFQYNDRFIDEIVENMKKDINREPIDAKITMVKRGVFNVTPEVVGKTLEEEKLKNQILSKINGKFDENEIITIEAPVRDIVPKYTKDVLSKIDSKISSYETSFRTSGVARSNNIIIATKSINGTLLLPGEEFSFNGVVGKRTADKGYQAAHVIIRDKLVNGLGGGICQVSSTLYNALLLAHIDPTERKHHTIASSYVPIGRDATVDWGNIDFKFVNTLEYPIYIEGFIYNKRLHFNIYSNSTLKRWSYKVFNDVYEILEPKNKIIEDPKMYEDEQKIEKHSYRGFKVKVYRNVYKDGVFVKKELISQDYIPPINGIIRKGTKKRPINKNEVPKDEMPKEEGNDVTNGAA
ncbi:vancomycin B-type resistance protein VanW [Clostridium tepidiprofundi DSM 19306]|uniref:Vancomycin B-type resistance protein VanW n=1 Tax=Clostridium tepidiprofundi DSM 19306 TaxID=1121338 RepID=A0A151B403_9CLOT|nr:VanW family protein [Clostridium tepidiprofundi]KYH34654.1 vancomycin B-type resistance protein VanW [Clostridium tepidiprofundi DSM 19306]